ncbi:MAG: hypothetical protein CVU88_05030 [Firmicutes bacterium HGW-Firmicutes-13]|nr:MAG: hypothetical protein CVU88_05030 [Firmicutes bacterium HGW-Firmicutes-13]
MRDFIIDIGERYRGKTAIWLENFQNCTGEPLIELTYDMSWLFILSSWKQKYQNLNGGIW